VSQVLRQYAVDVPDAREERVVIVEKASWLISNPALSQHATPGQCLLTRSRFRRRLQQECDLLACLASSEHCERVPCVENRVAVRDKDP
jgi:hypothetical protein